MANRIPWNMHEAAVLLQGLLDIRANKVTRAEVVANISSRLRSLAVQSGYVIDEKFRNVSGIDLQMLHLEYALTNGKTGISPAYNWQHKIIEIFRENPTEYKKLLEEVDVMPKSVVNTRTAFIDWLNQNMSAERSAGIEKSITTADILLRNNGEIHDSVLDVNNLNAIDELINRLKARKIIHSKRLSTQILTYVLAVKKYKKMISDIDQNTSINIQQENLSESNQEEYKSSLNDTNMIYRHSSLNHHNDIDYRDDSKPKKFTECNNTSMPFDNIDIKPFSNILLKYFPKGGVSRVLCKSIQ